MDKNRIHLFRRRRETDKRYRRYVRCLTVILLSVVMLCAGCTGKDAEGSSAGGSGEQTAAADSRQNEAGSNTEAAPKSGDSCYSFPQLEQYVPGKFHGSSLCGSVFPWIIMRMTSRSSPSGIQTSSFFCRKGCPRRSDCRIPSNPPEPVKISSCGDIRYG